MKPTMKTIVRYSFLILLFLGCFQSVLQAQTISGPATVCGGVKYRYTFNGTMTCPNVSRWEVIGAVVVSGGNYVDVTFPKAGYNRMFKIFADYVCLAQGTATLDVLVVGQYPITSSAVDIPCTFLGVRTFQTLSLPDADQTVSWANDAGWPVANGPYGQGNYKIDYNINNSSTGTVAAFFYNNGCPNYPQGTHQFSVSRSNTMAAPTFTTGSPAGICATSASTVAVNALSPAPVSYQWYTVPANVLKLNGGSYSSATAPLSTTTPSVSIAAFSSTLNGVAATLYVRATYASGCNTPYASRELKVASAVVATPTLTSTTISGPDEPSEYQFTATAVNDATYNWYVGGALRETSSSNTFRLYLPCRTSATVYCTITNQCGASGPSNSVTRTGGCRDRERVSNFSVSPNPASNMITITQKNDTNKRSSANTSDGTFNEVNIYEFNGNLVKRQRYAGARQGTLNVGDLRTGTYYIEIRNGEYTEKQTLIIQK
jgi:hypothetical protein